MSARTVTASAAAIGFWIYAAALVVATHMPRVHPDVIRMAHRVSPLQADKTLHLVAYGILGALAGKAFAGGRPAAAVVRLAVALAGWACLDEISQPVFGRTADVWDWCFDVIGVVLGLLCVVAWQSRGGSTPVSRVCGRLTELLKRRTSSNEFIPQIDGLRFYAVVAVLVFHCTAYLASPAKNPAAAAVAATPFAAWAKAGHSGVELFFVISGIVLGLPFARAAAGLGPPVNLRRYFTRRLTRLEPPYIINLLLLSAALLLMGKATLSGILPHLAASLAYCHNIVFGTMSTINFVAWSLEIEVQFYILAPLLAALFSVRDPWARSCAFGACITAASALSSHLSLADGIPPALRTTLGSFLQYFLTGFAVADWYARSGTGRRASVAADALAIPCVACVPLLEHAPVVRTFLLPLAFGGLCVSALYGRIHGRITALPFLVVIGGMCYTIYLYHPFIKSLIGPYIVRMSPGDVPAAVLVLAQVAAFLAIIVAVCTPLFLMFEKPFMAVGARRPR